MSITKNNTYYRFQAYSSGEYLNIYTDGAVKNNTTVTTFKLNSSDNCQIWKSVEYSAYGLSGTILKSRANEGFVLDRLRINDSTGKKNDADVYTLATSATDLKDQLVAIESATQGYCKIKLVHENLYLTVTDEAKKAGGYNVRWLAPTGGVNQLWLAQECISKTLSLKETVNQWYIGNDVTVRKKGCALCCGVMISKYYGYSANNNISYFYNNYWASNGYQWLAPTAKFTDKINFSVSGIKSEIDAGHPVALHAYTTPDKEHWVTVIGYNGTGSKIDDFIVADPYNPDANSTDGRILPLKEAFSRFTSYNFDRYRASSSK